MNKFWFRLNGAGVRFSYVEFALVIRLIFGGDINVQSYVSKSRVPILK